MHPLQAEDAEIYDEVTEEQYKSIVGGRLARDDFIEDDDGSGYVDNGMDVWEKTRDESDAESDEEERGNIKRCESTVVAIGSSVS
jgi:DNA polymerase alpha subunit A